MPVRLRSFHYVGQRFLKMLVVFEANPKTLLPFNRKYQEHFVSA